MKTRLEARFGPERADRMALMNRNMVVFQNLVLNDIMAITIRTFFPDGPARNSELLGMLQQAEMDGNLQYQQWADAETNPEVAQLFRLNGREETRRFARVAEVKKRLAIA